MVEIYTARMGYRGDDWLDVTRQGNIRRGMPGGHRGIGMSFAPSAPLLFGYLAARRDGADTEDTWRTYVDAYTAEMRTSYREQRVAWETLLGWPSATLLCFCTDATRCHRTVLAGILGKLGAEVKGERA